jgi:hypothetical protein
MQVRSVLMLALGLSLSPVFAQSNSYAGNWSGTMEGNGGRQVPVEVTLMDSGGTWRMTVSGPAGRGNPCFGKDLPLVLETTPEGVVLDIKGAQVITGCLDQRATLTHVNGKLTGTLKDGRAVTLVRK